MTLFSQYNFLFLFLLFVLAGCTNAEKTYSLSISPYFLNEEVSCDQSIQLHKQAWNVSQLQFFIADVEVQNKEGVWKKLVMATTPFQSNNVALIGSNCQQSTAKGNWQLKFNHPLAVEAYNKIRFRLGVPFSLNHLNPLQQQSPLNVPSMFWVWRTGHKFLRLELLSADQKSWMFHLGSTGCSASSPVRTPKNACINANLTTIELPMPTTQGVAFNLSSLIHELPLNENTSCQSEPESKSCQQLFNRIGLTGSQVLFEVNDEN